VRKFRNLSRATGKIGAFAGVSSRTNCFCSAFITGWLWVSSFWEENYLSAPKTFRAAFKTSMSMWLSQ
jgi:hypothetical protein